MNSVFSEEILGDKLSKLNSTQQCIETLSHWCIFHRSKAEQVVATWDKQFHCSEMVQKVPLLYLANDILQNSKRKGNEFVTEFWKVLPSALKDVVEKGDDHGKTAVSRLVGIWEERKVFGSRAQSLKDIMLGEEMPPPLELGKKRSRSVRIVKRDSRSIRTKLSIGGAAEKIVSAFHLVQSERMNEDEGMSKCKSTLHHMKKMETDVDVALMKANDPSQKTLAKELEKSENLLRQSIDRLKVVEANRVALVSQLRGVLHEQESELENLRTQIQVATARAEEASKTRELLNKDSMFKSSPSTTLNNVNAKTVQSAKRSAAAIAAEVADKLAASTSSQYIMTSVLSTFAAQEAKNAELMKSSTPSTSILNGSTSKSENLVPVSDSNNLMPGQNNLPPNNPYQQISNSQALYHSIPNPALQYMQPSGGIVSSYEYGSLPPFPTGPSPPAPPSYVVNPMVQQQPLIMGYQLPTTSPQQQHIPLSTPPSFRPLAPLQVPGMLYYTQPYQS